MAAESTSIWTAGSRIDSPLLRLIESYVRGDLDLLAGDMIAGKQPLVIRGFTLATFQVGGLPKNLTIIVENGVAIHYGASVSGSIFRVPAGREFEVLNPATNSRVRGSWGASRANYVGLDISRPVDVATKEELTIWDPVLEAERKERLPLARTQDYVIVITDVPFEQTNLLPLWIVTTDGAGAVSELRDARPFLGALSSGGSDPDNHYAYPWPQGRSPNPSEPSKGGDKAISSLKEALDAIRTRIREIGGGEYWYSAVCDRNVKMKRAGSTFSTGEFFEWDGSNLHWQGLAFLLPNSGGTINEIVDQLTDSAGLTNLADGDCLYVDLNYSEDKTGGSALALSRTPFASLGAGDRDKSRTVVAWRYGTEVYVRDSYFSVGSEPFVSLRNALTAWPVFRRVRANCATSPTLNIEDVGVVLATVNSVWTQLDFSNIGALNLSTLSGGLANNTRYYVYGYYNTMTLALAYEVTTTAPDSQLRFKTGTTTHVFLSTFYTNTTPAVLPFSQVGGRFEYLLRTTTGGGASGNKLLDSGTATILTSVAVTDAVPAAAGIAHLSMNLVNTSGAARVAVLNATGGQNLASAYNDGTNNVGLGNCSLALAGGFTVDYSVSAAMAALDIWVSGFDL